MKEITLKKIMKSKPDTDPGYLFHTNLTYPTIEDNESNFITDYQANAASYNGYAILKRGNQVIKVDEEDYDPAWNYLKEISGYITDAHLTEWARLYFALSLSYNPLYNVDGTTTRATTQKQRTDAYGAQSGSSTFGATDVTDVYGAKSATLGAHTDTQTNSSVSFDSQTEKETGQTQNAYGAQTNTELERTDHHTSLSRSDSHSEAAHSDTHTDAAFSETETRKGNIGVTMSQQLLEAEWEFRRKSFFATIINQMLDECGFYYNGGISL